MKVFRVGLIGATGMVGQRFLALLENHPWFDVKILAASSKSAGRTYEETVKKRWKLKSEIPEFARGMVVLDAQKDIKKIASEVDFVFCAVNMKKDDVKLLEEAYAEAECPVVSNNSACRSVPDVPMIIPEINPGHVEVIDAQRKRLGTKRGFIAVKSNCSIQSYVPAISALMKYEPTRILVSTYQAISGAGKTFAEWPEMNDNIIPYISGEEEKSEIEPLKIWGDVENDIIVPKNSISISTQCIRVPISDGHMATVFVSFNNTPSIENIKHIWENFSGEPQTLGLPTAPRKFLNYFEEDDRPQVGLDRNLENGMAISIGRLRQDVQYDYKFVCLSHNTIRGAAGGAILMAELLAAKGYFDGRF